MKRKLQLQGKLRSSPFEKQIELGSSKMFQNVLESSEKFHGWWWWWYVAIIGLAQVQPSEFEIGD